MTPDNFQEILNVIALALIVSIIWEMKKRRVRDADLRAGSKSEKSESRAAKSGKTTVAGANNTRIGNEKEK